MEPFVPVKSYAEDQFIKATLVEAEMKYPEPCLFTGLRHLRKSVPNPLWHFVLLFIYLAALSLSCTMWNCWPLSWNVGSLVVAYELLVATCGIWFPDQGSNPGILHWDQSLSHQTTKKVPLMTFQKVRNSESFCEKMKSPK